MADAIEKADEGLLGPPASNLRKNSNRTYSVETNMAQMGEKSGISGSVKKSATKNKPKKQATTPSIKDWIRRSDENLGYHKSWSLNTSKEDINGDSQDDLSQGQIEERTESQEEWPEERGNAPQEDWQDGGRDAQTGNYLLMGNNQQQDAEEGSQDSDAEVILGARKEGKFEEIECNQVCDDELIERIDELNPEETKILLKEMCIAMKDIQTKIRNGENKYTELQRKLNSVDAASKLNRKALIRHDTVIATNTRKISQSELRSMKNNMIVSGIKEEKGEKCIEVAKSFFKQKLQITQEIKINNAHRIGKQSDSLDYRNMVIVLKFSKDKAMIYKHAKNLKDKQNEEGKEYYISDQLPPEQTEASRQRKQKVKLNKQLIPANTANSKHLSGKEESLW